MAPFKLKSKIALISFWLFGSLFFANGLKAEDPPPDGRVSGGTRTGVCQLAINSPGTLLAQQLVALLPESQPPLQTTGDLTLWFYVPFKSPQPLMAEFRLKQKVGSDYQTIDKKTIAIPQNSPLFSLTVPQKQLAVGQDYQWFFSIPCQPGDPSKDAMVYARVRRVAPSAKLQTKLQAAKTIQQRVQIYQAAGLWYDAMPLVMRDWNCKDPQQAQIFFADYLRSIQLGTLAPITKSAFLKVCQP
jgi:hypothetical protein